MIVEHLRGIKLLQLALVHDSNPARHGHGFGLVMGDIDEGCLKALVELG